MNFEASLTYAFNRLRSVTLLLKVQPTATVRSTPGQAKAERSPHKGC